MDNKCYDTSNFFSPYLWIEKVQSAYRLYMVSFHSASASLNSLRVRSNYWQSAKSSAERVFSTQNRRNIRHRNKKFTLPVGHNSKNCANHLHKTKKHTYFATSCLVYAFYYTYALAAFGFMFM